MKIVIGLLAAAILGTGGFAFAAGVDDTQPARTVSVPGTTTAVTTACRATTDDIVIGNAPAATTTANGEDISGPCDEAEHRERPALHRRRCRRPPMTATTTNSGTARVMTTTTTTRAMARVRHGDDNSGHGSGHDSNDD
jgi:hypothetical protein